ncbi:MAG: GNAT family N-acetyltransferase [Pseudomonadota bacterium]
METADLIIRSATEEDTAELIALHAEAWRYSYRGVIPWQALEGIIARWRPVPGPGTFVLCFDGKLAGYASFGPERGGRRGEIYELYLSPAYQGTGLGRQLFQAARHMLTTVGLNGLVVWSLRENQAACQFYRAMGGKGRLSGRQRLGGRDIPMIGFEW